MPTEVTNTHVATEALQKLAKKPNTPVAEPNIVRQVVRQADAASGLQVVSAAVVKDGNVSPAKPTKKDPSSEDVKQAVSHINNFVQSLQRDLHFQVDDVSGRIVIEVIDSETKEIIRTIPPEEALKLAELLKDSSSTGGGLLLQDQA